MNAFIKPKKFWTMLVAIAIISFSPISTYALVHVTGSYLFNKLEATKFETFKVDKIQGFGLGITVFNFIFQIDTVTLNYKGQSTVLSTLIYEDPTKFDFESTLYSFGYRIDLPLMHIAAALSPGIGSGKITGLRKGSINVKPKSKIYLEYGYSPIPLFDIIVGLHIASYDTPKFSSAPIKNLPVYSGNSMGFKGISAGVSVGF